MARPLGRGHLNQDENMKKIFLTALLLNVFAIVACTTDADEADTFDASVVCPADGLNKYGMPNRGTFIDERDGQEYKYTTIGDQVWMAQNLNYETEKSICQGKDPAKCDLYGRFYNAFFDDLVDWDMIDSICPKGWHVPSLKEWNMLVSFVKSPDSLTTANRLKSIDGWSESTFGAGTDDCGFSALPGGKYSFESLGEGGGAYFLLSTANFEYSLYFSFISDRITFYDGWISYPVRCLKD